MPKTDVISKSLIKEVVMDMAKYLLGLNIKKLKELATEKQRIETRHADIVMLATDDANEEYILHLELQHSNQSHMPLRMMRYYTDIALSYPKKTIKQYVIYTGAKPLSMKAGINQGDVNYSYTLLDMKTLDCERFIAEDSPDALVLAILCDYKHMDAAVVIEKIIKRLIELTGQEPKKLRKYLKMMEILSSGRKESEAFKQVEKKMLSEINIEKLPSYQIGWDKGINQGIEQGAAQSMIAVARSAKQQGVDMDMIKRLTGLSESAINKL